MPDYQPGVTLITCTGGRKEALALCAAFFARQTWGGPCQWIIVNDMKDEPATFPVVGTVAAHRYPAGKPIRFLITQVWPKPVWQPGQNTLARNLLAAIPEVRYDKVLFIEDDDWYAADYVERMVGIMELRAPGIAGDPMSRYYHLPTRQYRGMLNHGAASLCQTGISAELLPELGEACRKAQGFIDFQLWQWAKHFGTLSRLDSVVGMKGLPGRPGIGVGHHPERHPKEWTADPDLSVLRAWIGDDVELYREFLEPACQPVK